MQASTGQVMVYADLQNESHFANIPTKDCIFRALGYHIKCIFVISISVRKCDYIMGVEDHKNKRSCTKKKKWGGGGGHIYFYCTKKTERW